MTDKIKYNLNELMDKSQIVKLFMNITSFLSNSKKDNIFKDEPDLIDQRYFFESDIWEKITGQNMDEINELTVQKAIHLLIESLNYEDTAHINFPHYSSDPYLRTDKIRTRYPKIFVVPVDKISRKLFAGELNGENIALAMERKGSKKKITTLVSVDFDNLDDSVRITGKRNLTDYDREVHDSILTLYVEGENDFVTPQMIYQVMTGNPKANLIDKQSKMISDSITRCLTSRITIDATEEAIAYGFDKLKYEGSLISGEKVTATLNGKTTECLHLLRPPVLYDYISSKNHVDRIDIKLLNTPINKNSEVLILQGYLYRRILAIKGPSNVSPNIVYDTLFKKIEIKASSDGALKKKKSIIRKHTKNILDYWKDEKFISGYIENKKGNEIYSITVKI